MSSSSGVDTDITEELFMRLNLQEREVPHIKMSMSKEIDEYYELGKVIGRGSFGVVLQARDKITGVLRAIKIVPKNKAGSLRYMLLEREVKILKLVEHPHIIYLDKVIDSPKKRFLVFELCDGVLAEVFKERKVFTENEAKHIIHSLASAVSYLHKHDIVHRDLKLENILVTTNPRDPSDKLYIKVIDFGLGIVKGGVGYENMLSDFCGTLSYMAPEVIENKLYSQQCDVWAIGVITFLLLSGHYPFRGKDEEKTIHLIRRTEPSFSSHVWSNVSLEAKELIRHMLTKDPAFRMTAAEISQNPWVVGDETLEASLEHSSEGSQNVLEMMRSWNSDIMPDVSEKDSMNETAEGPVAKDLIYINPEEEPHNSQLDVKTEVKRKFSKKADVMDKPAHHSSKSKSCSSKSRSSAETALAAKKLKDKLFSRPNKLKDPQKI